MLAVSGVCETARPPLQRWCAWERGGSSKKGAVVADQVGKVQEYDGLADFDSPVDFSSGVGDFGTADGSASTNVKEEFGDSCATEPTTDSHAKENNNSWQLPWGGSSLTPPSTAEPNNTATPKSARKKRSIRDILREVTVSEETLQCAVASLGGGAQGLQVLMDHVNYWASESPDADVAATIRNGIVDLGMPAPARSTNYAIRTAIASAHCPNYTSKRTCTGEPTDRGAAYTRALRKSHMARQRGRPARAQRGHHGSSGKGVCGHHSRGQWRTGAHPQSWIHDLDLELGSANGKGYEFLFQKELRASDVSSLGRIVLPKKDAERHFPFLIVKEGIMINLEDYHSGTFWTVRYKFWPNNKSRMYLLENIGGFVSYHLLEEGDLLLCYRNGQGGYVIQAQKVPPSVKAPAKGLGPTGTTQAREATLPAAEMITSTMNVDTPMPPTPQFIKGDESTTNTTDSNSDLASSSLDSLECTLRKFRDAGRSNEDGRRQSCVALQMDHYFTPSYDDVLVETGCGFGPAPYKPHDLHESSYDPVVAMLSMSNVKQRYLDGDEFSEP